MSAFVPSPPHDFAVPTADSMTARAVFSMALRKLFEDLRSLRVFGLSADLQHDYTDLRRTLVSFLPGNPGAIASLLRSPNVATPLRCLRDGLYGAEGPDALTREFVHQSFFQLSLQGALTADHTLRSDAPARMSAICAASALPAQRPIYLACPAKQDAHLFHRIEHEEDDVFLAKVDNNPLRHEEAHPDKSGNPIGLGDQPASAWCEALNAALLLLRDHMPAVYRELGLLVRQFVPVGFDRERHLSATYQQAIGTVYLSLHPDPMTMVEAMIHEMQHTKLNALLELDPLLLNDRSEAYASPVRPDPRPLHGVLLAVHAFVPVAHLYACLEENGHALSKTSRFAERRRQIIKVNHDGAEVLKAHARPTKVGRGVLDELYRHAL